MDRITEGLLAEFSKEFGIEAFSQDVRFEHFAAWLTVRRHYSDTTFEPAELVTGKGDDTGIDAIAVIANNNLVTDVEEIDDLLGVNGYLDVTFVFVQAERSPHFDSGKIGKFGFGIKDFFGDGKLPKNDAIKEYRKIMGAVYDASGKFRSGNPNIFIYYVTTGAWNNDNALVVRAETETADLRSTGMFGDVEFIPVGANQIQSLYRQTKNAISREFVFDRKVVVPEVQGVTAAYLGFVSATDLLKLVCDENGEIVKSLFYENVRDYLGLNSINHEIEVTLNSPTVDKFILMNNGVTMITRTLKTTGDKFAIGDFQVVNGCQTSHVLHANRQHLLPSIRVPLRLIHTTDESVIEDIIRATNRQTEVRDEQFFAMKDFAKKLEQSFKTYPVERRIYYERRPHQYDHLEIEKTQIITHQNLVRAFGAMFLGLPHITTRRYSQLNAYVGREMFCDGDKLEPYYVAAFALYKLEQLFRNKKVPLIYRVARFQVLLVVRFLLDIGSLPKMGSKEMEVRSGAMIKNITGSRSEKIFTEAISIIDTVAGKWNSDSIRNEPTTKAIFEKFGHSYRGALGDGAKNSAA